MIARVGSLDGNKALLNICYPISRIYVGKRVDESVGKAFKYMFFWGTLLAWKMYFSYTYEVKLFAPFLFFGGEG